MNTQLKSIQLKDIVIPNFWHATDRNIADGFLELMKEFGFRYLEDDKIWNYANEFVTVSPGDICIDCGSNIGLVSAWMATKGASKVYAFEPAQNVYPWLLQTVKLYFDIIEPYNIALGAADSEIMFTQTLSIIGSHFNKYDINPRAGFQATYPVQVKTIDNLFKDKQIDFIKMDCEGAERDILLGAQEVIRRCNPKMVISYEHLSDDKEMLFKIIKAINPNYNIMLNQFNFFCWVDKS